MTNTVLEYPSRKLSFTILTSDYLICISKKKKLTVDIIKKYAHRLAYWVSEPDKGIYDAMNKAIAAATGDYINFMNAGDKFVNETVIAAVVEAIEKNNKPDILYGDTIFRYTYGDLKIPGLPIEYLKERIPYCHQSAFVKTNLHKQYPFDTSYKICADYNFCYQMYFKYHKTIVYADILIALYEASLGVSSKAIKKSYREKYRVWNLSNNVFVRCKYELKFLLIYIRFILRSLLPKALVIRIMKYRISKRMN